MTSTRHIGTSGWSYAHWHWPFYPGDLPRNRQLEFYAERFTAVELNNTFYGLPAYDCRRAIKKTPPSRRRRR